MSTEHLLSQFLITDSDTFISQTNTQFNFSYDLLLLRIPHKCAFNNDNFGLIKVTNIQYEVSINSFHNNIFQINFNSNLKINSIFTMYDPSLASFIFTVFATSKNYLDSLSIYLNENFINKESEYWTFEITKYITENNIKLNINNKINILKTITEYFIKINKKVGTFTCNGISCNIIDTDLNDLQTVTFLLADITLTIPDDQEFHRIKGMYPLKNSSVHFSEIKVFIYNTYNPFIKFFLPDLLFQYSEQLLSAATDIATLIYRSLPKSAYPLFPLPFSEDDEFSEVFIREPPLIENPFEITTDILHIRYELIDFVGYFPYYIEISKQKIPSLKKITFHNAEGGLNNNSWYFYAKVEDLIVWQEEFDKVKSN